MDSHINIVAIKNRDIHWPLPQQIRDTNNDRLRHDRWQNRLETLTMIDWDMKIERIKANVGDENDLTG